MGRKKILWLCSWYPSKVEPFHGDFIQRHAQAAAIENDIHVIHVTYDCPPGFSKSKQEIQTNNGLTEHIIYFKKKKLAITSVKNQLKWAATFKKAIRNYIVKKGKPDLVHLHIPVKAGWLALWVKRHYKIPYVVTEHWGIYNHVVDENFESKNIFLRKLIRKVFQSAAQFITVSRFLGETIKDLFGLKDYVVVHNTVNTKYFYYKSQDKNIFQFIHVSNMVPLKNTEGILRGFKNLLDKNVRAKLWMVGKPSPTIQDYARQLALSPEQVQFTGEISYQEVALAMQKADCLLLFSDIENSPCVIGEALCCGLPVIVTRVGGIPELVRVDNSILVEPKDEMALTVAMHKMVDTINQYNQQKIAEDAAACFSFEVIGKAFDREYEKLISTKPNH